MTSGNLVPSQELQFTSQDNVILFEYTFKNKGGKPYYVSLKYTDRGEKDYNVEVKYTLDTNSSFSTSPIIATVPAAVINGGVVQTEGEQKYFIQINVSNINSDALFSGDFYWTLSNEEPEMTENVTLNVTNATGSSVGNSKIVYNSNKSQFRIDGPVPNVVDGSVTNLDEITNSSGQEFYYFSTNSSDAGASTTGVTRYYASTSSDPIWYDNPEEEINIYSIFLTPNCSTGTQSDIGSNTDIIISHSVTTIPSNAFMENEQVINITIPNSVYKIESIYNIETGNVGVPFMCPSLQNILIPSSVKEMGTDLFVKVFSPNLNTNVYDNGLYIGTDINPYAHLVGGVNSNITSIEIHNDCESIQQMSFLEFSNLTQIVIPQKVKSIGYSAFLGNGLINVTFEENSQLTSIGDSAFYSCSSLTSIDIPSLVTSIGTSAFRNCSSLTSVTFGDNSQLTSIGNYAFYECSSLTSIVIPSGVTSIGSDAFQYCYKLVEVYNLSSLNITKGLNSNGYVGYYALDIYTNLSSPSKLKYYGDYLFYEGGGSSNYLVGYYGTETELTLPTQSYNYAINKYAFYENDSITSIVISSEITSIGDFAFSSCVSLTSIDIPSGITSIGEKAFYSCSSLTSVTFGDNSQLTSIGDSAFRECSSLTSIDIPSGITSIGEYAFSFCSSLASVTFGDNSQLTSIGSNAFYNCSSLTSIVIPSLVTSIGSYAFYSCSKLTIYCEVSSQTSGWDSDWNSSCRPVYWAREWSYDEQNNPIPNA